MVILNCKHILYLSMDNGEANLLYSQSEVLLTDAKGEATAWVNLRNFVLSIKPERGKVHTE